MEPLIILLLGLHLLAMNVASAGPLVTLWFEYRERSGDETSGQAATYLALASIVGLLIGGLLGLLIGWLSWSERYEHLWLVSLRYKAAWAVGEYVFSLLLLSGYVFWRRGLQQRDASLLFGLRSALLFLSGTNLLYHFPFLFSVAANIAHSSQDLPALSSSDFRGWMIQPDILARVVHIVFASVAVSGIAITGLAMRKLRLQPDSAPAARLARQGAWIALVPSLLQIPTGLWIIAVLPPSWQARALGGDVASVVLLGSSVLLALWMMQDLASVAFGDVQRKYLHRAMILMVVIVLAMTGVLRRIRPPLDHSTSSNPSQTTSHVRHEL